ncbi:MAG: cysteine--1-D-myo-inosityl 2-amino-2-deoxy-alpha-D-glucopyranoside ligase [Candidatus Nanopelagicales bacterium]
MQPWREVNVPVLNLSANSFQVYDSRTQELKQASKSDEALLYVCGITPYDATHMGHAATYVAFDTLHRFWLATGTKVQYTQNITDIDDPLLERAKLTGRDWQDIAVEQIDLFKTDMEALRVIPPQNYVGVVEAIEMIEHSVIKLKDLGVAYQVENDWYFDMSNTELLGEISHLSAAEMLEIFAQRGGDPDRPGKRNPFDALLWRGKSGDDPDWPSELGSGRPGWHIECSAIATHYLGNQVTVQGGGSDLKFPHHEMSAAHAESLTGVKPFAQTFMHAGMVSLDGEKMSKSLGNLIFVSKLRIQGIDPMAIRLVLLSHHYRSDWEWFDSELSTAQTRLENWRAAFDKPLGAQSPIVEVLDAMSNDLDTPAALKAVDDWARETISGAEVESSGEVAKVVDAILGIV